MFTRLVITMPTPRTSRNRTPVLAAMAHNDTPTGVIPNDVLINRYVTYKCNTGRRPWRAKTEQVRRSHLRLIAAAMPVPLAQITEDHVQSYRATLIRQFMPETVCARVATLRGLGRWMVNPGRIRIDDPTAGLEYVDVPESGVQPTESGDYDLALACALASRPEMYVWLGLMGCLGLRCCEIAWMMTYDIEYLDAGRGSILHIIGKGGKRRSVPAPRHITACLRPFAVGRGPMFTRPSDGLAYKPPNVSWHVRTFLQGIGVESSAHPLRRRFARDYHALDPDVVRQAELMGHSSTLTTRRYIGITPLDAAEYIERMVQRRMPGGRRAA